MITVVRCPRTGGACYEGTCRERHWCRKILERRLSRRSLLGFISGNSRLFLQLRPTAAPSKKRILHHRPLAVLNKHIVQRLLGLVHRRYATNWSASCSIALAINFILSSAGGGNSFRSLRWPWISMESPSMTEATPMMRSCATALNTMGGASNRPRDFQLHRPCAVSRNVIYFSS